MTGYYRIRLPSRDEQFIDGTMLDPSNGDIILREDQDEMSEEDIEEVLNHEFIHLAIGDLESYLVSGAIDSISGWICLPGEKAHLVFISEKLVIFQLPLLPTLNRLASTAWDKVYRRVELSNYGRKVNKRGMRNDR